MTAVNNAMCLPIVNRLCEPDCEYTISQVAKRIILVVDDDSQVRRLIPKVLTCEEYDVVCVSSSEEAVRMLAKISPCLILLDLHLSSNRESDGFNCLSDLRTSGFKGIIYILSGDESFAQVHKAARLGADGYLVKRNTRTFWNRLKDHA
jgi:DNA-binding response OmpR family regulator